MSAWRETIRRWFAWRPPVVGASEGMLLRLGMALAIWFVFFGSDPRFDSQPHPNGLAEHFDLTFISVPETWQALKIGLVVALTAYVAGFAVPLTLGYTLWLMICYGTLRNSQGAIHHGSQLLATALLAQWVAYVLVAIRDKRAWLSLFRNTKAHSRALFYSQQAIVAGYLCAGIMKVERGKPAWSLGWHWVEQIPHMAIMVTRNGVQQFYNDSEGGRAAMEHGARVGGWITENPTLAKLLFLPGLYMELLIVFALCNRRLSFWIGLILLIMHWLIGWTMQLRFPLNECLLVLFTINVAYLIVAGGEKLSGGRLKLLAPDDGKPAPKSTS